MNRKQKIIVSVTSIFLVLLLLVGLTYAYFLTQINGNENSKSISVTTANLTLVYGDGNGIIEPTDKLIPGTTIDSKTFTVKNEGNAETDYVVVIEDVKVTYATTVGENVAGTTTTFESNDFVYTLTCESDGEACDSINTETTFPINNGILVGNKIEVGKTHTYTLTVTYKETGVDQSNDMNKTLEAKVNIRDIAEINPYSTNKNTLAYNIINNAIGLAAEQKNNGYAELRTKSLTTPAVEPSSENESVLSIATDDYGTSYYYRGAVKNNYVTFNNMCWRIVRIEGDGAIKLILADKDSVCSSSTLNKTDSAYISTGDYGYKTINGIDYPDYENSQNRTTSMKYRFNIFLNGGSFDAKYYDGEWKIETKVFDAWSEEIKSKLKTSTICIGDIYTKYNGDGNIILTEEEVYNLGWWGYHSYNKLANDKVVSLVCPINGVRTSETQIFPLTAEEAVFAGGSLNDSNAKYYLLDNITSDFQYWWTLSLGFSIGYDTEENGISHTALSIEPDGFISPPVAVNAEESLLRPAVSLIPNIEIISGDGTINNPYVVG